MGLPVHQESFLNVCGEIKTTNNKYLGQECLKRFYLCRVGMHHSDKVPTERGGGEVVGSSSIFNTSGARTCDVAQ